MPRWIAVVLQHTGAVLDRLQDSIERFMAMMCAVLVIPLTGFANLILILHAESGPGLLGPLKDNSTLGWFVGITAGLAAVVALHSAFGRMPAAVRNAHVLDRIMRPIAYTASGLMILFVILLWVRG